MELRSLSFNPLLAPEMIGNTQNSSSRTGCKFRTCGLLAMKLQVNAPPAHSSFFSLGDLSVVLLFRMVVWVTRVNKTVFFFWGGGQLGEFIWLHWILRPWPQPWPGQQKGTQRAPAPDDPQGRGAQALRPARSPAPPPGASLCFNCLLLHEKPLQNLKLGSAGHFFFFAVVIPHGVR